MKKLIALLVALMMLGTAAAALADTLTMGTNANFPPYEYYENKEIVGIDAEIAAAIADKLGMELDIKDIKSGQAFYDSGDKDKPWDIRMMSARVLPDLLTLQPRGGFVWVITLK